MEKLVFSIVFRLIEIDNFCETVLDTHVLGHSNFSGMCV